VFAVLYYRDKKVVGVFIAFSCAASKDNQKNMKIFPCGVTNSEVESMRSDPLYEKEWGAGLIS
jgi:hypothetical protein